MRWLPLALLLAACGGGGDVVSIAPTLSCADEVSCHVIEWRLGVRLGPQIAGTHIRCRCVEAHDQ